MTVTSLPCNFQTSYQWITSMAFTVWVVCLTSKSEERLNTIIDDALLNFCKFFLESDEVFVQGPHERLVGAEGGLRELLVAVPVPRQRALRAVAHDLVDELLELEHHLPVGRHLLQHRPQTALQPVTGQKWNTGLLQASLCEFQILSPRCKIAPLWLLWTVCLGDDKVVRQIFSY